MEATCSSASGNPGQSSILEVIFEYKESRKPLSIPRDSILKAVENKLATCVGDACSWDEPLRHSLLLEEDCFVCSDGRKSG